MLTAIEAVRLSGRSASVPVRINTIAGDANRGGKTFCSVPALDRLQTGGGCEKVPFALRSSGTVTTNDQQNNNTDGKAREFENITQHLHCIGL